MSDSPQYPSYPGDDSPATGSDEGRQPPPGHEQPAPPPWGQQVPQYGQVPPPAYGQMPPGYAQPPLYGFPAPQYVPTSTKAVFSLVLGIASIVLCLVGVLIGPAAIVLSVYASKEIDARPPGTMNGKGMATAGLATGIVGTAIWGLVFLLAVVGSV
ncbi:DUF4190 domain-containing protein [Aeromicrobium wangtongii]|uniref:DUF4190 domain-containing protein n=1 Tax=Aeromicrobium wangtongii TaxID=2969247 RepID=A0ABY5MD61_9ACTN|nr:DUF4190 domain-containing protein [Aeromicrobium wangtongii]MCD9197588.1 DUF4190 domain-containing protein [Aeromicrobium wangtongii]UUP15078.1 DUF4190 domain-containing protein [Aeromicrobium wangtongii]